MVAAASASPKRATPPALKFAGGVSRFLGTVALTFFGLLLVTFLIGRVVPIDPVLDAIGDRAPTAVYERVRVELGLDQPLYIQFYRYVAVKDKWKCGGLSEDGEKC